MKRSFRVLIPLCVAVLAAVFVASPAQAGPPATPRSVTIVMPMRLGGFDPAVAKAHGFSTKSPIKPDNTVYGECGSSYVKITPTGNAHGLIQTGFTVDENAVSYSWTVHVLDDYGVSNKHWGGTLALRTSWVGTNNFHSTGPDWAYVEVTYGVAVMWDGDICYSEGPWDNEYLY